METALVGSLTKAGSIHKVENGFIGLPSMNEPGTISAIGDSLHNPEGSVMCAGFFELKASEPLVYTYTYDAFRVHAASSRQRPGTWFPRCHLCIFRIHR
jgi:ethanolamine utilization protein EutQ